MRGNLAALTGTIALAAVITACSSSGSVSSTQGSPTAASRPTTSVETIYGKVTGSAALASNPEFHLTFTGPVNTTAATSLGSSPKKGSTQAFDTGSGNLVVTAESAGTNSAALTSTKTCLFKFSTTVPFTVDGARSTGKFAGATGTGKVVVAFSGDLPKLSNGHCNESRNAQPTANTAVATFTATTKLTVKGGSST